MEIWISIKEYEGLYEVSNYGNVRSCDHYGTNGTGQMLYKGKLLKICKFKKTGYCFVSLHKNGKVEIKTIHRLVANAFLPNPTNLPCVNHKDENKSNNNVENLEWCTVKYNTNYGTCINRRIQTGINNGNYNPETCNLTKKEYHKLYYQNNKDKWKKQV